MIRMLTLFLLAASSRLSAVAALAQSTAVSPAPVPPPLEAPNWHPGIGSFAYSVGVLVLICIGAYLTVRFLYGKGGFQGRFGMGKRLIRVLDRYTLGTQRFLVVVEVAGKVYLLGVSDQAINFLTALDSEALAKDIAWIEQNETNFTPFNSYLSALSRRWKKDKTEPGP